MKQIIPPGSTIGILGSGQLGRMLAIAARRLGYRIHVLSPEHDTPAGQVSDREVTCDYDNLDEVERFARRVDVVTFEFENVPRDTIESIGQVKPVHPGPNVLHTTQNRLREKNFLKRSGLPVARFQPIRSLDDLVSLPEGAFPAVLKTSEWGYDGKGQRLILSKEQAAQAWIDLNSELAVLEEFVDFERELSVVAARGCDGQFVSYTPTLNIHRDHILDLSMAPAPIGRDVAREAEEITRTVFELLGAVGVMCVEFFQLRNGSLVINEIAPRPHNSGHLTIDANASCQFEQQVRAVCGLRLGSTQQRMPAAMANLIGDLWDGGPPNWAAACAVPDVRLHLYGKREPRPGRKMGHVTSLAPSSRLAAQRVLAARAALETKQRTSPTVVNSFQQTSPTLDAASPAH